MKNWKIILTLVGAFVFGTLAGGLVTSRLYQNAIRKAVQGGPTGMADLVAQRLGDRLRLNPEQREKLAVIIRDGHREMRQARQPIDPQLAGAFARSESQIRAILTTEQTKTFDLIMTDAKARWTGWQEANPPPQPQPANYR